MTGKRDIADFYVVIRQIKTGEIVYETTVGYNRRNVDVPEGKGGLAGLSMSDLQLCIIAKRSNHELGFWSESQCVRLSDALREGSRGYYQTTTSNSMRLLSSTVAKEVLLLMHFFCLCGSLLLWRN